MRAAGPGSKEDWRRKIRVHSWHPWLNCGMHNSTRRQFLSRTGLIVAGSAALAPLAAAIPPFQRAGKPKLMPSLAGYSFRQFFKDGRDAKANVDAAKRIDLFGFVD